MKREKKAILCNKLVSAFVIVMLILSSYGTFLSEATAAVLNYEGQKTEAGDKKVHFDAYFKSEEENVHDVTLNTDSENYLYLNLTLEEGIIQNAKITLNNPNFEVDYEDLKTNSTIKNVDSTENSIELNQISSNTEIPIKVKYKSITNLAEIEKDTEINLEGIYTNSEKTNKEISGKISVKVKWSSAVEGNLESNIENYIEADGKSVIISNTVGTISNVTLPMEYVELTSNVPEINGVLPETVNVLEDGKNLDTNSFTYDQTNKTLTIRKENAQNDNEEIGSLSGNVNYSIVYIYANQFNLEKVSYNANQELKVKPYTMEETDITFQNVLEKERTNQTTVLNIESVEDLSKGYMYWQTRETPFNVDMDLQIKYILPNRDIEIVERENDLTGENLNLNVINSTYYVDSVISKNEVTNILGENGSLEIYDANSGNLITTINKDTQADESGNITINYENVSRIRILIRNPEKLGNIHINSNKKLRSNHGINNETLKAVNKLKLVFENNNMIFRNTAEREINLHDTVTKSTLEIDKTEFFTNEDLSKINMRINLNTQNIDYDLYKNPVLQVIFPSEFETVNIDTVGISFENGLKLSSSTMKNNEDGTKTLTIFLTGEQLEYLNNDITANTQIAISGSAKVYQNLTSHDTNITYIYTNEKAITYDNNGTYNLPIKVTAPYGFIMTTEIEDTKSKNRELNEVTVRANTVEQDVHVKETIINNFDSEVSNFELTGMIPLENQQYTLGDNQISSSFNAEIDGNISINRNDAKIYFSEDNVNWSETKTEDSNLFKITFDNSNLNKGDNITLEYDLKIPDNISNNKSSYLAFIANGTQNNSTVNNWSGMKVSTEGSAMNNAEPLSSTVEEGDIRTEISVMKGNVSLEDGDYVNNEQNLKYIVKLTNTTGNTINNIKVSAKNTNAVFYEFMDKEVGEDLINKGFYENPDKTQQDFTVESLPAGQSVELSYQVIVKKAGDGSTTQATVTVSADSIEEKQIQSIENEIVDSKLKVTIDPATTSGYPDDLNDTSMVVLGITVQNLTDEVLENVVTNTYYTEYLDFANITKIDQSDDRGQIVENANNVLKVNIANIQPQEKFMFYIYGYTKDISNADGVVSFYTFTNALYDDTEYISGQLDFTYNKVSTEFTIVQTSNIENEVEQDDNLIYTTQITNTGDKEALVSISDDVPENAVINHVYLEINGQRSEITFSGQTISTSIIIEAKQTVTLIIDTTINTYINNDKEISNTVSILSGQLKNPQTSNTVTHKIIDEYGEPDPEEPDNPDPDEPDPDEPDPDNPDPDNPDPDNPDPDNPDPDNPDPDNPDPDNPDPDNPNPDNPDPDNPDPDNPNPDNPGTEEPVVTREINGFAWNDADKDGVKDTGESNISNIRVLLITGTGTIVEETITSQNGYYEFSSVTPGTYRIVFEYDSSTYYISPYKVNGIDEDSNSDVLEMEIEENGERKKVAATEEIVIDEFDMDNINAGFIEFSERSLNITKTITGVTVRTNKRTQTYDFDRKQIAKVEIASKEMPNAVIEVEYTIDIQNTGETEETIQEIIDNPSSDLQINGDSDLWYTKGNQLATSQLENTIIAPGETKSVTLTMVTTTGSEGQGKNVTNAADISSVTSDNENLNININNENNTAQLIIGIKTGALQITIGIILTLLVLGIIATIIIKRRGGLRRND